MTEPLVLVDQRGPVRCLSLNRPRFRNALSTALDRALVDCLDAAAADETTSVVLLTGTGGAFCSGVDLTELSERGFDGSQSAGRNCITTVAGMVEPVIGLVDGPAVTGGFELALACDLLIATPTARFADTHARVGIVPGGGLTARLAQAVGVRRARQLSATGAYLSSDDALACGLVNEVVDGSELLERGWSVGAAFAAADQPTLRAIWRLYDELADAELAEAIDRESQVNAGWQADADSLGRRSGSVLAHGRAEVADSER